MVSCIKMKNIGVLFNYHSFQCTLKDTLTAENSGASSWTASARPESLIYIPKRDNKHRWPIHIGVPMCSVGYKHSPARQCECENSQQVQIIDHSLVWQMQFSFLGNYYYHSRFPDIFASNTQHSGRFHSPKNSVDPKEVIWSGPEQERLIATRNGKLNLRDYEIVKKSISFVNHCGDFFWRGGIFLCEWNFHWANAF